MEHPDCMSPRCGCADSCAVSEAAHEARVDGIVAGLEMADKFLSLTKDRQEVASMIKAAILAARN